MPNNQSSSTQKRKTKINYLYLVRQFPFLTFLHYLTGFLSAYSGDKILTNVTKFINDKEKNVNVGQIKGNFGEIIIRLLIFYGVVVLLHIAMEIWLVEVYSSHLRKKLAQKYLSANFSQTQKARFILTNYENEAINAGTKAAQIFNRCFYAAWAYRPRFRRVKDIQRENSHFEELKTNIEYIKTTGTEKKEIEKNNNLVTKNLKKIFPLVASKSVFATIPNYLLVKALPLPFLLIADTRGTLTKGGYDGYCSSLKQLNNGFAILEKETYSAPKTYLLPPKKPNISFQTVEFAYPEAKKKILDNFSFTFQQGKKYAIIGPNGIGKSTLFKLIIKLYQPQQGVIKLGNAKLEKIDNSALREKIIYLPNNPFFFNTSLGDNIVYPDTYQENIHQEKLENIAKKLGIEEFIDKLPNRQKQLVSLMRVFIKDYEIYLFDEFLSNVSSDLKAKILKVVFRELRSKTVLIITHDKEVIRDIKQKLVKKTLNLKGPIDQKQNLTFTMFTDLLDAVKKMIERLRNYTYYFSAKKRLNEFLAQEERNDQQKNLLIPEPITQIELKKVSFAYRENKYVLKKLDIKFSKGQVNYLTGANGFGKTKIAYAEHENLIENGLSTGQKQLADLNSLFTNSENKEVFIFDEADNALDENNKKEFREKITKISKKKLILEDIEAQLRKLIMEKKELKKKFSDKLKELAKQEKENRG
ncbi:16105_t:CDS:2 [Entrophospora sp. SA101]|nr:16105_t:CDS:2 [Entrophospora sp. SA101]